MNSSFWSREFVEFEEKGPGPIATELLNRGNFKRRNKRNSPFFRPALGKLGLKNRMIRLFLRLKLPQ